MKKTDKIAILGYGVEGRAMCEYLLEHGYGDVTVCDRSEDIGRSGDVPKGVKFFCGEDYLQDLSRFDVVFRSPGISFFTLEIQELLDSRTVVSSMTKYFFEHSKCPIIGVTGTKGKGTTASLITEILRRAGRKVFLGGNIGVPAISFLDELSEDSLVVLELSSFQLVDLEVSPHVAVVLNVTSDHMDYHSSVEEYRESKHPIVEFQVAGDMAVLNRDYPYAEEFGALGGGEKLYVSCRGAGNGLEVWIQSRENGDVHSIGGIGIFFLDESDPDPRERGPRELIAARDIALLGRHNLENVLPAFVVARKFGVRLPIIETTLREFRGLPHRLELVGSCAVTSAVDTGEPVSRPETGEAVGPSTRTHLSWISFYNDSFSTTPEACLAACNAFNDMEKPFYLIAGGSEKGSDFTALGWKLSQMKFLREVFLMGPAGVRIGDAVAAGHRACVEDGTVCRLAVSCKVVDGLKEAVSRAFETANALARCANDDGADPVLRGCEASDIVILMSPAAASFNEFKNYKERGERFRDVVKELMG